MSEVHGNQGPNPTGNHKFSEEHAGELPKGITFKGEKTDLRYDPSASVKKTWIKTPIKAQIGEHTVTFGSKQIQQVQKDLELLDKNPAAVQRATALYPAFLGYAKEKGVKHPESMALALEHYAATNEFIEKAEI